VFTHSSDAHHHLPPLVRFHHLVRFSDFFRSETRGPVCLVTTGSDVIGDGLERDNPRVENRGCRKQKTAKELKWTPLDIWSKGVEVGHRSEAARKPARHARPPRRSMARESRIVLLPDEIQERRRSVSVQEMRLERSGPSNSTRLHRATSNSRAVSSTVVAITLPRPFTAIQSCLSKR